MTVSFIYPWHYQLPLHLPSLKQIFLFPHIQITMLLTLWVIHNQNTSKHYKLLHVHLKHEKILSLVSFLLKKIHENYQYMYYHLTT